eukprot:CAMPEP_0113692046 /NCGR_PEP_ID=MMETSP0038_2-20120614/18845_1 /TAXON_ID=2898 /ORGANISM="Cryptomonas paramecium" /LENGTH=230 /DNA_ID=CAMNT_0000613871 /DNA_START=12 /DNA_END=699 /DNA_ORIENTATION=- /assembly_acc=CAM_ASM_000170
MDGGSASKGPSNRWGKRENEFFFSRKNNLHGMRRQIQKLLEQQQSNGDNSGVFVHALGAAIPAAINFGLSISNASQGEYGLSARTASVTAMDDETPNQDSGSGNGAGSQIRRREVSAIHLHIYRSVMKPPLRTQALSHYSNPHWSHPSQVRSRSATVRSSSSVTPSTPSASAPSPAPWETPRVLFRTARMVRTARSLAAGVRCMAPRAMVADSQITPPPLRADGTRARWR